MVVYTPVKNLNFIISNKAIDTGIYIILIVIKSPFINSH